MPRSLSPIALVLLLALAACQSAPPPERVEEEPPPVVEFSTTPTLNKWLNRQEQVAGLTPEQVAEELHERPRPEEVPELFEFALLNHYSQQYEDWIKARDAFRILSTDESLSRGQRQMAALMEAYNQQRINSYQRLEQLSGENDELQRQLADAELRKAELEEKIQALTELEANISTRKDQ